MPAPTTPTAEPVMNAAHFTDDMIDAVQSGQRALTAEERAFLVDDTARMEECSRSREQLSAMTDGDLMTYAYGCWVDYCRGMF